MKNHFNNSIHHEGTIYGFDNAIFKALDAATSEERWKERGLGKGSLILAAEHLIVLSERGELLLVEATPESFAPKARMQALQGKSWTPPSLAHCSTPASVPANTFLLPASDMPTVCPGAAGSRSGCPQEVRVVEPGWVEPAVTPGRRSPVPVPRSRTHRARTRAGTPRRIRVRSVHRRSSWNAP